MAGVQILLISLSICLWSCVAHNPKPPSENGDTCFRKGAQVFRRCGVVPRVNYKNSSSETAFGEFPWQVAIIDAISQQFICSGVLIDSTTVLTAWTCTENIGIENILVRIGEWDIMSNDNVEESYKSDEIPVNKKVVKKVSDIAQLKLKRPVDFDTHPHVVPVCLPSFAYPCLSTLENCVVAGWNNSQVQVLQFPTKMVYMESEHGEKTVSTTESENYEYDESEYSTLNEEMEVEDEASPKQSNVILSKKLEKASVHLQSEEECSIELSTHEFCVFGSGVSLPCKADIGAAVVCEFDRSLSKIMSKEQGSKYADQIKQQQSETCVSQWELIGIVTESYSCDEVSDSSPIIAENILGFMGKVIPVQH